MTWLDVYVSDMVFFWGRLLQLQVNGKEGRNVNNLRYADDTTLMAESEKELKSLLMKWKRRVKKLA